MNEVIAKVIPILLLIGLGYMLQYRKLVLESSMQELKKGVINIALPAVLFLTFKNMVLKKEYLYVTIITFFLLLLCHVVALVINKISKVSHPIIPYCSSGCALGLLGIPLFGSVFGLHNLDKFSIFAIGHEVFVWFVLMTLIRMRFSKSRFSLTVAKDFIKSPLILSIVLGVGINIAGLSIWFEKSPFLAGIDQTIQYMSSVATPLILVIIGYGLKLNKKYLKDSIKLVVVRLSIVFIVGYTIKLMLLDPVMGRDTLFDYAFFTFLVLPPPFSVPLFIGTYSTEEHGELANNTVVLNTIVCIVSYIFFVMLVA